MLSKKQINILKYVKKNPYTPYKELCMKFSKYPHVEQVIMPLYDLKYIESRTATNVSEDNLYNPLANEDGNVVILNDGEGCLLERFEKHRNFWIPIIISVIALIKSFLPEIMKIFALLTR